MSLELPDLGWGPFRRQNPRSVEIGAGLAEQIWDGYQEAGDVISIRPYNDDYGLDSLRRAESFLNQLHRVDRQWRGWTQNVTPPNSLELVYDANAELLQFRHVALTDQWHDHIRSELESHYQNAEVQELPPSFIPFDEGMYASAAYLRLRDPDYLKPIKNFKDNPDWYKERDPYDSVAGQMTGYTGGDDAHVVVQMTMKPAFSNSSMQWRNWHSGIMRGPEKTAKSMGSSDKLDVGAIFKEAIGGPLSQTAKDVEREARGRKGSRRRRTSKDSQSQTARFNRSGQADDALPPKQSIYRVRGEKGFHVNIRIVAIADDPETAERRVKNTAEAYESFYDTDFQQGFVPVYPTASEVRDETVRAARREYVDRDLALGQTCWACVGRYPNVSAHQADYTLKKSDAGVPPRTARPDEWDVIGYTDGDTLPQTARERYEQRDEFGWPYEYVPHPDPDPSNIRRGRELVSERAPEDTQPWDDEDTYMGAFYQYALENAMHGDVDDQPLFIGVDSNGRPVPLTRDELRTHFIGTGYTGEGKSTLMVGVGTWFGNTGGGVFMVDPGGEDTYKYLMALDADRLDDVIVMDIGSNVSDYRVGINLLDTFLTPDDPGFEDEVDAKLDTILPLLDTDEYKRMKRISEHIFRGLIESNFIDELPDDGSDEAKRLKEQGVDLDLVNAVHDFFDDDHEATSASANWTIEDARDILQSEENRQEWYQLMKDHGQDHLVPYARTLAEMDDDDDKLEPLLGRLKSWLESPRIKSFASLRQSTINLPQAILDEKIIILKADTGSDTVLDIATGTAVRFVWQTFLQMPLPKELRRMEHEGIDPPGNMTHDDYSLPDFLLLIDELAAVISDSMNLDRMLAEGRKRGLRVGAFTQQYRNLPDEHRDSLANTGRQFSFAPGNNPSEARRVADIYPGLDKDDISSLESYHSKTMDDAREPFEVEMAPPVPPRRSFDEVHEFIVKNEERYGVHKDDIDPIGLVERFPDRESESAPVGDDSDSIYTDQRARSLLAVLFGLSIDQADPGAPVPTDGLVDALDAEPTIGLQNNHLDTLVQRANSRGIVDVSPDGSTVTMTDDGAEELWDSGTSGNAGTLGHQAPMEWIARGLLDIGYTARVPRQNGEEMPDLYATLPVEPGGESFEEAKAARDTLRDDHENVWELSGERDVAVEFEKATLSAPSQIAHNLRKAVTAEDPDHVLFVVNQGDDGEQFADLARKLADKLSEPMLTYAHPPTDVYRRFHHQDTRLLGDRDGPQVAVPADGTYQWVDDSAPDEPASVVLRLSTDDGYEEIARFDSLTAWRNRTADDFPVTFAVGDEGVTVSDNIGDGLESYPDEESMKTDYTPVFAPFVPEEQFGGEFPESDAWDIAVLPNDRDLPLQYYDTERDTCYPLSSLADEQTSEDTDSDSIGTASDTAAADDGWDEDVWSDENW